MGNQYFKPDKNKEIQIPKQDLQNANTSLPFRSSRNALSGQNAPTWFWCT